MHYVYILKSSKDQGFYVGCSGDLKRRYFEHELGMVASTKHRKPLELVYYEAYSTKELAMKREKKLKDFGSAYIGLLKRLGQM
jgi:putative endonuclease